MSEKEQIANKQIVEEKSTGEIKTGTGSVEPSESIKSESSEDKKIAKELMKLVGENSIENKVSLSSSLISHNEDDSNSEATTITEDLLPKENLESKPPIEQDTKSKASEQIKSKISEEQPEENKSEIVNGEETSTNEKLEKKSSKDDQMDADIIEDVTLKDKLDKDEKDDISKNTEIKSMQPKEKIKISTHPVKEQDKSILADSAPSNALIHNNPNLKTENDKLMNDNSDIDDISNLKRDENSNATIEDIALKTDPQVKEIEETNNMDNKNILIKDPPSRDKLESDDPHVETNNDTKINNEQQKTKHEQEVEEKTTMEKNANNLKQGIINEDKTENNILESKLDKKLSKHIEIDSSEKEIEQNRENVEDPSIKGHSDSAKEKNYVSINDKEIKDETKDSLKTSEELHDENKTKKDDESITTVSKSNKGDNVEKDHIVTKHDEINQILDVEKEDDKESNKQKNIANQEVSNSSNTKSATNTETSKPKEEEIINEDVYKNIGNSEAVNTSTNLKSIESMSDKIIDENTKKDIITFLNSEKSNVFSISKDETQSSNTEESMNKQLTESLKHEEQRGILVENSGNNKINSNNSDGHTSEEISDISVDKSIKDQHEHSKTMMGTKKFNNEENANDELDSLIIQDNKIDENKEHSEKNKTISDDNIENKQNMTLDQLEIKSLQETINEKEDTKNDVKKTAIEKNTDDKKEVLHTNINDQKEVNEKSVSELNIPLSVTHNKNEETLQNIEKINIDQNKEKNDNDQKKGILGGENIDKSAESDNSYGQNQSHEKRDNDLNIIPFLEQNKNEKTQQNFEKLEQNKEEIDTDHKEEIPATVNIETSTEISNISNSQQNYEKLEQNKEQNDNDQKEEIPATVNTETSTEISNVGNTQLQENKKEKKRISFDTNPVQIIHRPESVQYTLKKIDDEIKIGEEDNSIINVLDKNIDHVEQEIDQLLNAAKKSVEESKVDNTDKNKKIKRSVSMFEPNETDDTLKKQLSFDDVTYGLAKMADESVNENIKEEIQPVVNLEKSNTTSLKDDSRNTEKTENIDDIKKSEGNNSIIDKAQILDFIRKERAHIFRPCDNVILKEHENLEDKTQTMSNDKVESELIKKEEKKSGIGEKLKDGISQILNVFTGENADTTLSENQLLRNSDSKFNIEDISNLENTKSSEMKKSEEDGVTRNIEEHKIENDILHNDDQTRMKRSALINESDPHNNTLHTKSNYNAIQLKKEIEDASQFGDEKSDKRQTDNEAEGEVLDNNKNNKIEEPESYVKSESSVENASITKSSYDANQLKKEIENTFQLEDKIQEHDDEDKKSIGGVIKEGISSVLNVFKSHKEDDDNSKSKEIEINNKSENKILEGDKNDRMLSSTIESAPLSNTSSYDSNQLKNEIEYELPSGVEKNQENKNEDKKDISDAIKDGISSMLNIFKSDDGKSEGKLNINQLENEKNDKMEKSTTFIHSAPLDHTLQIKNSYDANKLKKEIESTSESDLETNQKDNNNDNKVVDEIITDRISSVLVNCKSEEKQNNDEAEISSINSITDANQLKKEIENASREQDDESKKSIGTAIKDGISSVFNVFKSEKDSNDNSKGGKQNVNQLLENDENDKIRKSISFIDSTPPDTSKSDLEKNQGDNNKDKKSMEEKVTDGTSSVVKDNDSKLEEKHHKNETENDILRNDESNISDIEKNQDNKKSLSESITDEISFKSGIDGDNDSKIEEKQRNNKKTDAEKFQEAGNKGNKHSEESKTYKDNDDKDVVGVINDDMEPNSIEDKNNSEDNKKTDKVKEKESITTDNEKMDNTHDISNTTEGELKSEHEKEKSVNINEDNKKQDETDIHEISRKKESTYKNEQKDKESNVTNDEKIVDDVKRNEQQEKIADTGTEKLNRSKRSRESECDEQNNELRPQNSFDRSRLSNEIQNASNLKDDAFKSEKEDSSSRVITEDKEKENVDSTKENIISKDELKEKSNADIISQNIEDGGEIKHEIINKHDAQEKHVTDIKKMEEENDNLLGDNGVSKSQKESRDKEKAFPETTEEAKSSFLSDEPMKEQNISNEIKSSDEEINDKNNDLSEMGFNVDKLRKEIQDASNQLDDDKNNDLTNKTEFNSNHLRKEVQDASVSENEIAQKGHNLEEPIKDKSISYVSTENIEKISENDEVIEKPVPENITESTKEKLKDESHGIDAHKENIAARNKNIFDFIEAEQNNVFSVCENQAKSNKSVNNEKSSEVRDSENIIQVNENNKMTTTSNDQSEKKVNKEDLHSSDIKIGRTEDKEDKENSKMLSTKEKQATFVGKSKFSDSAKSENKIKNKIKTKSMSQDNFQIENNKKSNDNKVLKRNKSVDILKKDSKPELKSRIPTADRRTRSTRNNSKDTTSPRLKMGIIDINKSVDFNNVEKPSTKEYVSPRNKRNSSAKRSGRDTKANLGKVLATSHSLDISNYQTPRSSKEEIQTVQSVSSCDGDESKQILTDETPRHVVDNDTSDVLNKDVQKTNVENLKHEMESSDEIDGHLDIQNNSKSQQLEKVVKEEDILLNAEKKLEEPILPELNTDISETKNIVPESESDKSIKNHTISFDVSKLRNEIETVTLDSKNGNDLDYKTEGKDEKKVNDEVLLKTELKNNDKQDMEKMCEKMGEKKDVGSNFESNKKVTQYEQEKRDNNITANEDKLNKNTETSRESELIAQSDTVTLNKKDDIFTEKNLQDNNNKNIEKLKDEEKIESYSHENINKKENDSNLEKPDITMLQTSGSTQNNISQEDDHKLKLEEQKTEDYRLSSNFNAKLENEAVAATLDKNEELGEKKSVLAETQENEAVYNQQDGEALTLKKDKVNENIDQNKLQNFELTNEVQKDVLNDSLNKQNEPIDSQNNANNTTKDENNVNESKTKSDGDIVQVNEHSQKTKIENITPENKLNDKLTVPGNNKDNVTFKEQQGISHQINSFDIGKLREEIEKVNLDDDGKNDNIQEKVDTKDSDKDKELNIIQEQESNNKDSISQELNSLNSDVEIKQILDEVTDITDKLKENLMIETIPEDNTVASDTSEKYKENDEIKQILEEVENITDKLKENLVQSPTTDKNQEKDSSNEKKSGTVESGADTKYVFDEVSDVLKDVEKISENLNTDSKIAKTEQTEKDTKEIKYKPENDKSNEENDKLLRAATLIQKIWKGFHIRKLKSEKKLFGSDVTKMKTKSDEQLRSPIVRKRKNDDAALKIQALWRGYKVRRNVLHMRKKVNYYYYFHFVLMLMYNISLNSIYCS